MPADETSRQDIRAAVSEFLELLEHGRGEVKANVSALEIALDRLALAYHFSEDVFDDVDQPDPPDTDRDRLRRLAVERFPGFGYYNVPGEITEKIMEAEMVVGDALDDVVDIARDLSDVAWRWEHTSAKDALWHFRFGYEHHWGWHLRNLQLYLHALRREA